MKILSSALVLFLIAVSTSAQTSSASPDVTVLQNKWRIDLYNPALDKDPLAASKEHRQEEIQQQAAARENENRIRHGEPALPPVVHNSAPDTEHRVCRWFRLVLSCELDRDVPQQIVAISVESLLRLR